MVNPLMLPLRILAFGVIGLLTVALLTGCATTTTTEEKAQPAAEAAATTTKAAATTTPKESKYAGLANLAQHSDPNVTAYCNEVPMGHACHAVTASPSDPNESPQRNCTESIVANASTSCAFAENAFYEAYKAADSAHKFFSLEVYSPVTHTSYELGCEHSGRLLIGCISSPTSDGIYLSFTEAAIVAYTEEQAQEYAAKHSVGHPPAPAAGRSQSESTSSEPEESKSSGESNESSGEEDEVGSSSHATDAQFCSEHECIESFTTEGGTIVRCSDGSYSHAGGISGACSDHGGETEE
jgi:hypothetical protein